MKVCSKCGQPIAEKMGPTVYASMLRLRRECQFVGIALEFSSDLDHYGYIVATVNGRPIGGATNAGGVRRIVAAGYAQDRRPAAQERPTGEARA